MKLFLLSFLAVCLTGLAQPGTATRAWVIDYVSTNGGGGTNAGIAGTVLSSGAAPAANMIGISLDSSGTNILWTKMTITQLTNFFAGTITSTGSITGASLSGTLPETNVAFTDISTGNASTSKHGFLGKLDGNAGHYVDGTGALSTPAGASTTAGGPIYVATADATVANTASETSLVSNMGTGSKTFVANSLAQGNNVNARVRGRLSTKAISPGTLTIKAKLGSVVVWSSGAIQVAGSLLNDPFDIFGDIAVRTAGASGTVFAQLQVQYFDGTTFVTYGATNANTTTSTIDTTTTETLDFTATWSVADSGNTITGSMANYSDGEGLGASALPQNKGGTAATTAIGALDSLITAEANVASATTTDLGAATTRNVNITGTTAITGFGTAASGVMRFGRFAGVLTLTHNATSLILPGGANITTAANDRFVAESLGSGNWLVYAYQKADGTAVVSSGGFVPSSVTSLSYASTVNLDFSLSTNTISWQTVSLTGNVTFTTSNLGAGRKVFLEIITDTSPRTLAFPAWIGVGAALPSSQAASKTAVMEISSWSTTDATCVAAYAVQP